MENLHRNFSEVFNITNGILVIFAISVQFVLLITLLQCARKRQAKNLTAISTAKRPKEVKKKNVVEPSIRISLEIPAESINTLSLDNGRLDSADPTQSGPCTDPVDIPQKAWASRLKNRSKTDEEKDKGIPLWNIMAKNKRQRQLHSLEPIANTQSEESFSQECIQKPKEAPVPTLDDVLAIKTSGIEPHLFIPSSKIVRSQRSRNPIPPFRIRNQLTLPSEPTCPPQSTQRSTQEERFARVCTGYKETPGDSKTSKEDISEARGDLLKDIVKSEQQWREQGTQHDEEGDEECVLYSDKTQQRSESIRRNPASKRATSTKKILKTSKIQPKSPLEPSKAQKVEKPVEIPFGMGKNSPPLDVSMRESRDSDAVEVTISERNLFTVPREDSRRKTTTTSPSTTTSDTRQGRKREGTATSTEASGSSINDSTEGASSKSMEKQSKSRKPEPSRLVAALGIGKRRSYTRISGKTSQKNRSLPAKASTLSQETRKSTGSVKNSRKSPAIGKEKSPISPMNVVSMDECHTQSLSSMAPAAAAPHAATRRRRGGTAANATAAQSTEESSQMSAASQKSRSGILCRILTGVKSHRTDSTESDSRLSKLQKPRRSIIKVNPERLKIADKQQRKSQQKPPSNT